MKKNWRLACLVAAIVAVLSGCTVSPADIHATNVTESVIAGKLHRFAQSTTRPQHELPATIFYVGAHPDDIELFMGVQVLQDFVQQPNAKKVFIVTTAGDAGLGVGNGDSDSPYWIARRLGHERAVLFMVSMTGINAPSLKVETQLVGKHRLERRTFGPNIVMYDLNLPDGGKQGAGFALTGNQSLSKLMDGSAAFIEAIDRSNRYTLDELQATLGEIVSIESKDASWVRLNLSEDRDLWNPGDHPDHISTSLLLQQVAHPAEPVCFQQIRFATYANTSKEQNVTNDELMVHAATWGAINIGRAEGHQRTTWGAAHNAWLGKVYPTATTSSGTACLP